MSPRFIAKWFLPPLPHSPSPSNIHWTEIIVIIAIIMASVSITTAPSAAADDDDDNNCNNNDPKQRKTTVSESAVRPSICLHFIRHAESSNNEVYRNARYIYRGGTPEFDEAGWLNYVHCHRKADPGISVKGQEQAQKLADYFVPHLDNQASHPVRIICSPMRRTLETIQPTLRRLQQQHQQQQQPKVHIILNAFYHESEGCHIKDQAGAWIGFIEIGFVFQFFPK